jgi:hypothetical protein
MFDIDVGAHLNGSTASTIAHDVVCPLGENKRSLGVTTTARFADERSDNMVSTHTCVHPQHVKVVIDLRYVQH